MSPISSTLAGASTRGYGGLGASVAPVVLSSFESIATVTVGSGSTPTIQFNSIPQTFKHLQVRAFTRDARGATALNNYHLQVNGDTSNNYYSHTIMHDSTSITAAGGLANKTDYFIEPASGATTGTFASSIWDIYEYSSTDRYKVIRHIGGYDNNGTGRLNYNGSALYSTLDAINSLAFTNSSNANFSQYTSYALYGIKG